MFGAAVVCYLFLGGAGAGACLLLAVGGLLVPRSRLAPAPPGVGSVDDTNGISGGMFGRLIVSREYRRLFAPSYVCGAGVLVLGIVLLAVDLGRADRLLLLVTQPHATHLVIGAYALFFCVVLAVALALVWGGFVRRMSWRMLVALEVALCVCSLVVMAYTGLLLQSLAAVPLWNTVWLPVLFVLSSASCGFALVLGTAQFTGMADVFATALRRAMASDAGMVAAEILVAFALVASVSANADAGTAASASAVLADATGATGVTGATGTTGVTGVTGVTGTALAAARSAEWLLRGSGAPLFWGGFLGLGLVVPLVAETVALRLRSISANVALGLAACVLAGGFALRWCVVEAGMHPVLTTAGLG